MTIPPKESKIYTVMSSSSDPYLSGFLEIRLSADGVSIRWAGEPQWKKIDWYEIAIAAGTVGEYRKVLQQLREDAFEEGMNDGVRTTPKENSILSYRAELEEFKNRGGEMDEPLSAG